MQAVRYRDVPWAPLVLALLLTAVGVTFVISACYDAANRFGLGAEARMQIAWWALSVGACLTVLHVPLAGWRTWAFALYAMCLGMQVFMIIAADSPLVPNVKGQHNWIRLGPVGVQPSEFIKLGVLLCCARIVAFPGFVATRLSHVAGVLTVAAIPAAVLAKEDLGSGLTFPPFVLAMLWIAGMRLRHLALILLAMALTIAIGISLLPKEGPKAYQYQRIQAWRHPDEYALSEGYQTARSVEAIGSGQWTGNGFATGDQNRLGYLPEKHTDLIFAVVGEEIGFIGSSLALLLYLALAWTLCYAITRCRDPFGQLLIAGFTALLLGQASINLAVALGLMPVTGVTLPFFSYGGSSLLGTYLGLGLVLSASIAPRRDGARLG